MGGIQFVQRLAQKSLRGNAVKDLPLGVMGDVPFMLPPPIPCLQRRAFWRFTEGNCGGRLIVAFRSAKVALAFASAYAYAFFRGEAVNL